MINTANNEIPMVSIVIPAYNVELYMAETIGYLINQTFQNWELILVDDQSDDSTRNIIEKYCGIDSRIKLFVRDRLPKGAQVCRNTGVEKAAGKYLIILDSDDIIKPCCLQQRVDFMEEHPELDFSVFKGANYNSKTETIDLNRKWGYDPHADVLSLFLKARYPFGVWNCIFKTEVAKDIMFDEKLKVYQDFDFIVRTLLKTSKYSFAENSEIDYLYRQGHTGTITSNFTANGKYESTLYLFSKTMEELSSLQDSEIRKKQYYGFFKLQLEKVALSGTKEELREYFRFVRKYYGFPYSIKLSIAKLLLRGPFVNNQKYKKKYVHFIVALLYHPSAFVDKIRKK